MQVWVMREHDDRLLGYVEYIEAARSVRLEL
jgi:hypothetical protein